MVKSYNDPIKQLSRDKLLYFIYENLLTRKKPENINVVCFPGAEKEGEEGLEIKLIYDELGIPRENIFGLERNPDNIRRLEAANLGIKIVPLDAYDFFATTDKKFDVISLDYTSPRTYREADITRFIAGKQLLNEWGIYCTNHCGQREGNKLKEEMLDKLLSSHAYTQLYANIPGSITDKELLRVLNKRFEMFVEEYRSTQDKLKRKEFDLDELRLEIFKGNINSLSAGLVETDPTKYFLYSNPSIRKIIEESKTGYTTKAEGLTRDYPYYWAIKNACIQGFNQSIHDLKRLGFSENLAKRTMQIIGLDRQKGYIPISFERYSYNSNKNYKMIFDMIQLRHIPRKLATLADQIIGIDDSGMIKVNFKKLKPRKFEKVTEELQTHPFIGKLDLEIPDPTYLGSSWIPPKRKKSISKADAISLLREGFNGKDILEDYKGFSVGELAALKAHYVTMGKPFKGN